MCRKLILILTAAAIAISASPNIAWADTTDGQTVNNSVSGYVSLTEGVKIAGADKTPVIHIDEAEYDSVIRAAGDLSEDIKSVTGKTPVTSSTSITSDASSSGNSGISITESSMTVSVDFPVPESSVCYAAVYDSDGILKSVTEGTSSHADGYDEGYKPGVFTFDKVLSKPAGGEIKAFVWNEMEPVTGTLGILRTKDVNLESTDIVIGTLGASKAIDALAQNGDIAVSEIKGKWEAFTIQRVDDTIVIAGSDKRGTIYGIYDLCEKIGVSPWTFWADVKPETAEELYINLPADGYTEGEPSVKYRGIFLNDEYNFNKWNNDDGIDTDVNIAKYEKVYELILRLKMNYLWPAMHNYSTAFHNVEGAAALADKYGMVMGASHCEPLLRNNLGELDNFQTAWENDPENAEKTLYKPIKNESGNPVAWMWTDHDNNGNAVDNKEFLEDYWRACVQEIGGYENVYTLGMRGVHDGSFSTNMSDYGQALMEIIDTQRKILKEEVADKQGIDLTDIPQVYIPYKDVLKYYNEGATGSGKLKVPEDVTIMWTDDNYGYVRQSANDDERARSGGTGLYYHISYYGWPTSYLWLSSTQPGLIREELTKSYDMGSNEMWIVNVGDLKPAEKEIDYYARLARNINEVRETDISEIYEQNSKRDFNLSDADAEEYAEIMDEFYELANSKRPDMLRSGDFGFSLTAYGDEGQRYIDRYSALTERTEALYNKLPADKKPSFFELVLYPIHSAKNIVTDYIQASRASYYDGQGRGSVINRYAGEANTAAAQITADTSEYNTMLDGKWNDMMVVNPSHFKSCDARITTDFGPPTVSRLDYTAMGISADGQTDLSETPSVTLSKYDTYSKYIDIFNTGYGSFDYEITASSPAVQISKTSGTVYDSDRVYVKLDASQAPEGTTEAAVTVRQKLGSNTVDTKAVNVVLENPSEVTDEKTYVEAGGTVSIEAEHFSNAVKKGNYEWKVEEDFGRSGDSLKIYPNLADPISDGNVLTESAYTEYDVYFTGSGTYNITVYRMPTLNERSNMRFAVGVDGESPVTFTGTSAYSGSESKNDKWARGVLDNTEKLTGTISVPSAGKHTIRLYNIATGVVIDKMVLTKNTAPSSYFGAPESYNTTFNTVTPQLPAQSAATEPQQAITKLYEPDVVVGTVTKTDNNISSVNIIKLTGNYDNAVVAVAGYDKDGNMTAVNFSKADLSETAVNGQLNVPVSLTLTEDTTAYAVNVFDSFTDMQPIAPYKVSGDVKNEADSGLKLKTDISDYIGKKSVILIADEAITEDITADHIVYLYGGDIEKNSYQNIPFAKNEEGKYYLRLGISGEDAVNETKNTKVIITPDDNGEVSTLNTWSFDSDLNDSSGASPFVLSGGASRTDDGKIKMNSGSAGTAAMTYASPISVLSGGTLTVEFDIQYGKLSGKDMTYNITDSDGKSLAAVTIRAYNPSEKTSVTIGGTELITDYKQLADYVPNGNNAAADNAGVHYKNVFDFGANKAYITVSAEGKGETTFSGKINSEANNIKTISFTTNYTNDGRACLVDDVSVSSKNAPRYAISIAAVDAADTDMEIADAVITVKDAATGTVILPETSGTYSGKYMLSESDYIITAEKDGYRAAEYPLELTPALESKDVKVKMTSSASLTPAVITVKYVDGSSNKVKDDVTVEGSYYAGDEFTLPESYMADITVKEDGKTKLYTLAEPAEASGTLTANTEFTLVYTLRASYDYYEDFENYSVSGWTAGKAGVVPALENDSTKYIKITSNGSTLGAYKLLENALNCAGKSAKLEFDVKFAPTGTTGDSQFTIAGPSPSFGSNQVDYGIGKNGSYSNGHIIALEYNAGSPNTFVVNGNNTSTSFIGKWIHVEATADFTAKTVDIKLTADGVDAVQYTGTSFISPDRDSIESIGAIYMRAAKSSGTVSVDNIRISVTE